MKIVRVVATCRENGHRVPGGSVVVLCGVDDNGSVVDGQWMGFQTVGNVRYPFIWETDAAVFDYAWEDDDDRAEKTPTTLGRQQVKVGALFSTRNDPEKNDKWEATWEIISAHTLDEMVSTSSPT